MVLFYEKIGCFGYLKAILRRRHCYYSTMSVTAKVLDRLCRHFWISGPRSRFVSEFGWGDTEFVGHAVREAAQSAKQYLPQLAPVWEGMARSPLPARGVDLSFLLKKYLLVEVLYRKYFFFELLIRYFEENPSGEMVLVADKKFATPYEGLLARPGLHVHWRRNKSWLASVFALGALPLLMPLYWRRKIEPTTDSTVTGVVCNIENPKMIEGYLQLLQPEINPTFVVAPEYRSALSMNQLPAVPLVQLGLTEAVYRELKHLMNVYGRALARNFRAISCLGWHLLRFANKLVHGRIRAPSGQNYHLLTCEHHDLTKTIRNEFIRKQGGASILFPYASLYVLRFHADEYFENYDYVLSPGRHYEDTLRENESSCTQVFPVGTFAIHKHGQGRANQVCEQKILGLRQFVGNDLVVTILCPGVCKPTYPSEVKLMQLAKTLSEIDGLKVLIRQKPFVPEPKYEDFYEAFVRGNPSIMLTGMEYELFDFLPVTDLFVTTYSTSACELAVCGAKVVFVDCLKQDDRFIFWREDVVGGLLVSDEGAIDRICHVLKTIDDQEGAYRQDMAGFMDYIGYRFGDYETYRTNLMDVLACRVGIPLRGMVS